MTTILRSDLFRNFLGGFAVGAIALFALQPDNARAHVEIEVTNVSPATESMI